ncbi:MAG: hypothetical protein RIQ93_1518 [Verrucomicrobiota bacterium]|jgi:hypothetical protein
MSQSPPPERPVKIAAYVVGGLLALAALAVLLLPQLERVYAKGPANTGHETLGCADCHIKAPGTPRQQLQAKAQYWLGRREADAAFGHTSVGNPQCTKCHLRDSDSHPVHRFLEPRFADARADLGAQNCVSCHREHQGVRVTAPQTSCKSCHQELDVKNEPILNGPSHQQLVAQQAWTTCLGCHDFHGNHKRAAQKQFNDKYSESAVRDYLAGGASPYGHDMKFPAKKGSQ